MARKPRRSPGVRTGVRTLSEARQTIQRLRLQAGAAAVDGLQGPPGPGSAGNVLKFWKQYELKDSEYELDDPLFFIPPGWAVIMLRIGVYCWAANGNAPAGGGTWRIKPQRPRTLLPQFVNWASLCSTDFNTRLAFWKWSHPLQEGDVTVSTTTDSDYDYWPNKPFFANPELGYSPSINVWTDYGLTTPNYPGFNLMVWGEYILIDDPRLFAAPYTIDGSCPIYPKG